MKRTTSQQLVLANITNIKGGTDGRLSKLKSSKNKRNIADQGLSETNFSLREFINFINEINFHLKLTQIQIKIIVELHPNINKVIFEKEGVGRTLSLFTPGDEEDMLFTYSDLGCVYHEGKFRSYWSLNFFKNGLLDCVYDAISKNYYLYESSGKIYIKQPDQKEPTIWGKDHKIGRSSKVGKMLHICSKHRLLVVKEGENKLIIIRLKKEETEKSRIEIDIKLDSMDEIIDFTFSKEFFCNSFCQVAVLTSSRKLVIFSPLIALKSDSYEPITLSIPARTEGEQGASIACHSHDVIFVHLKDVQHLASRILAISKHDNNMEIMSEILLGDLKIPYLFNLTCFEYKGSNKVAVLGMTRSRHMTTLLAFEWNMIHKEFTLLIDQKQVLDLDSCSSFKWRGSNCYSCDSFGKLLVLKMENEDSKIG